MGNTGITEKQVHTAAQFLLEGGVEPSIKAVRELLGTGSLTTVSKYLNKWRTANNRKEAESYLPADVEGLKSVRGADPTAIARIIRNEHPQVVALILSHMDAKASTTVLQTFPDDEQPDLVDRIANIDQVPPEMLMRIDVVIRSQLAVLAEEKKRKGGKEFAATIVENLDGTQRTKLLEGIKKKNRKLADIISKQTAGKGKKKGKS